MKRLFLVAAIILLCRHLCGDVFAQRNGDKVRGHGEVLDLEERDDELGGKKPSLLTRDSGKWYITLLTRNGCPHCEQLKRDFGLHPLLKVFVDTETRNTSWAHWNICDMDDPSQAWRFKAPHSNVTIRGYPTLLIQPPLNGKYGDTKAIVFQKTGYDGDALKLARLLSESIERHQARASSDTSSSTDPIARRRSSLRR
jgi:hypothetical protein